MMNKTEKELELWGKNAEDNKFQRIKTYETCRTSGKVGPKREQGDRQIPEGYYHINRFNPVSSYHLSMGINYPNKSDRLLGVQGNLGGEIFIHGACVTIGCLPITDEEIEELYIFCVEARNNGQQTIPITIFPTYLTDKRMQLLRDKFPTDKKKLELWSSLKEGYHYFNTHKKLPNIQFLKDGGYRIN